MLLLASPAIAAGGQKGGWEFGPYAGYAWLDSYGGAAPENDFLYGVRAGYFITSHWSAEASYQLLRSHPAASGSRTFKVDSLRLNALYNFREGKPFRWHLTVGAGRETTRNSSFFDSNDTSWNGGAGVRYFFTPRLAVRGDARYVSTRVGDGLNQAQGNVEATVGAAWTFGGGPAPDGDHDGVPDRGDACPNTPKGASVDGRGCPTDADGDGVFDGIDSCANTPKGYPVDANGCPKDSDGDGVPDGADTCPNTPKGTRVDAKGCPMDGDGDGVFDGIDACPNTPKGAMVDSRGCPKDLDGDGVFDGIDRCPDTPANAPVDSSGCPRSVKAAPLFTETKKSLVLEGVSFKTNSAVLTIESSAVLDGVAASLKDWADVKVEVAGYTDSTGADAYNVSLSKKRAQSVVDYLASKGVDRSRMKSRGYGKADPIADNKTDAGRAKNRRVELNKSS